MKCFDAIYIMFYLFRFNIKRLQQLFILSFKYQQGALLMLLRVCSKVIVLLLFYTELINQYYLFLLDLFCLHNANKMQKKKVSTHFSPVFFTVKSILFYSYVAAAERRKIHIDCPKVN